MKRASAIVCLSILVAALPAAAARDRLQVVGSPAAVFLLAPHLEQIESRSDVAVTVAAIGSGQSMLDVLDGKAAVAAVAMPLTEAVAAAREAAWSEGRIIAVPDTIQFHEVGRLAFDHRPVGFITLGTPSLELERVLVQLRAKGDLFPGR
jgi:uncharacterized MnhB-related membrane protein